ncbi:MAG: hypothetical protein OXH32_04130 [Acidobacteria bacterium]|nr:hypothetical protein [Acidobacteriota bacterium]MXZ36813.1 hypothetical protein [Holophagales bacterium]MYF05790.1 hypothetical protein [Holophagales bacterium]MYJ25492.1 hypothetical protein [Holophagales bacterium]
MEPRLKQLLEDLTRSLCEAIAESPEVHDRLESIRREGYTLNLFLDCKPCESDDAARTEEAPRRPAQPPPFRINGRDLAFLRSVGIDPTRKARSRTSRR